MLSAARDAIRVRPNTAIRKYSVEPKFRDRRARGGAMSSSAMALMTPPITDEVVEIPIACSDSPFWAIG